MDTKEKVSKITGFYFTPLKDCTVFVDIIHKVAMYEGGIQMDPVMLHNDAAEKNARELIRLLTDMVNALKTDRMYDSYHTLEIAELVGKVQEYNAHVIAVDSLCKEW